MGVYPHLAKLEWLLWLLRLGRVPDHRDMLGSTTAWPNLGAQTMNLSNDRTNREENASRKPDPSTKPWGKAEKASKIAQETLHGQISALRPSLGAMTERIARKNHRESQIWSRSNRRNTNNHSIQQRITRITAKTAQQKQQREGTLFVLAPGLRLR